MLRKITTSLVLVAYLTVLTLTSFAKETRQYSHREIESWADEGMVFVVRDANGQFVAHAKGHLERWRGNHMVWVVRDHEGKFLTYAEGTIERWNDGSLRLVLRNKDGKFVAISKIRM